MDTTRARPHTRTHRAHPHAEQIWSADADGPGSAALCVDRQRRSTAVRKKGGGRPFWNARRSPARAELPCFLPNTRGVRGSCARGSSVGGPGSNGCAHTPPTRSTLPAARAQDVDPECSPRGSYELRPRSVRYVRYTSVTCPLCPLHVIYTSVTSVTCPLRHFVTALGELRVLQVLEPGAHSALRHD